jgi:uncharacterized protein (UPF0261 family)
MVSFRCNIGVDSLFATGRQKFHDSAIAPLPYCRSCGGVGMYIFRANPSEVKLPA